MTTQKHPNIAAAQAIRGARRMGVGTGSRSNSLAPGDPSPRRALRAAANSPTECDPRPACCGGRRPRHGAWRRFATAPVAVDRAGEEFRCRGSRAPTGSKRLFADRHLDCPKTGNQAPEKILAAAKISWRVPRRPSRAFKIGWHCHPSLHSRDAAETKPTFGVRVACCLRRRRLAKRSGMPNSTVAERPADNMGRPFWPLCFSNLALRFAPYHVLSISVALP